MAGSIYQIAVGGPNAAEANRRAADLEMALREASERVEVRREKDPDAASMDLGTTLIAVASTGAVTALAKGLADWLRRRPDNDTKITIRGPGGELVAENITSKDALRLLDRLREP